MITGAQIQAVVSVQGADTAKSQLADVGKSADQTSGGFMNMLKSGLANAAGFAVFNVGAKAVGFLKDQFADTLQVAMQHQDIMAQTAQVIKSTGDASGMSAQQISDLALSLSKTTTFSDDAIQKAENLGLTFTGIGKQTFPLVTQTALDMATSLHEDLSSAMMQVSKAVNEPKQGITALTREGVTFTDQQKKMIQSMVDAGNTAGAQKLMLQELQKEFGGSAQAAGQTFGGQLQILQNNLEDTKQKIGSALLPVISQLASNISQYIVPAISQFADYLQSSAFQTFASDVGQKVMDVFNGIGNVLKSVDWGSFADDFKSLGDQLAPIISNIKPPSSGTIFSVVGGALKTSVKDIGDFAKDLGDVIKWFKEGSTPALAIEAALLGIGIAFGLMKIGEFVSALPGLLAGLKVWAVEQGEVAIETMLTALPYILIGALVVGAIALIVLAVTHWGEIAHWLQGVWNAIPPFFEGIWKAIAGFFGGIGQWFHDRWSEASKGTTDAFGTVGKWFQDRWTDISNIFSGVGKWFSDRFSDAYNSITGIFGKIGQWFHDRWSDIVTDFESVLGGLGKVATGIWNTVVGAVKAAFNNIIDLVNGVIKNIDGISVAGFSANIPQIPHFATGTSYAPGGWAIVGEHGPEAMYVPRGAQIIPNNQISSIISSETSRQAQPLVINVNLAGRNVGQVLLPDIVSAIRYGTGNRSM